MADHTKPSNNNGTITDQKQGDPHTQDNTAAITPRQAERISRNRQAALERAYCYLVYRAPSAIGLRLNNGRSQHHRMGVESKLAGGKRNEANESKHAAGLEPATRSRF